jgi:hypothetical protein
VDQGVLLTGLVLSGFWIACWFVFGLFAAFSRPDSIERPLLVGTLTILSSLLAMLLLYMEWREIFPRGWFGMLFVSIVAPLGLPIGRVIDRLLGPREYADPESREQVLGSDLAD